MPAMNDTAMAKNDVAFAAVQVQHAAFALQEAREMVKRREHEMALALEAHGAALDRLVCVVAP